jgi:hypothetical protein
MFQIITASFLAVVLIADTRPFRKFIRLKKSESGVDSFRFPMALAALRKAIFSILLLLGILFESTLPPQILWLGASLNQELNCFTDSNFFISFGPTSIISVKRVAWLNLFMANKSTPQRIGTLQGSG